MRRILVTALAAASLLTVTACGSGESAVPAGHPGLQDDGTVTGVGDPEDRTLELADFTKIEAANDFTVVLEPGADYAVSLSAQPNIHDLVDVTVAGDTLTAKNKPDVVFRNTTMTLTVTTPTVTSVTGSQDVQVNATSAIQADQLDVSLSNDARLDAEFAVTTLTAWLENDAALTGRGTASTVNVTASNDAEASLASLTAGTAIVTLANDGLAKINATGTIDLTAENSARLDVYGGTVNRLEVGDDVVVTEKTP